MNKIKCNHCGYEDYQLLSINFDSPDLEKIENDEMVMPRFRIKCECYKCLKYIKFLPFKDSLKYLHNKPVIYDEYKTNSSYFNLLAENEKKDKSL